MRFETLVKSPKREMIRFIEFVEPESPSEWWVGDISAPARPRRLEAAQQTWLAEACARGQEIRGYAPAEWVSRSAGALSPATGFANASATSAPRAPTVTAVAAVVNVAV